MKSSQKSFKVPESKDLIKIEMDQVNSEVIPGVNSHKIDSNDCVAFSYQTMVTVANNSSTTIITPISIGSVIAFAQTGTRESKGSMMPGSTGGCVYVSHTSPGTDIVATDTKLISLGVGTVTSTINGKTLTIANAGVGATITVILTFFA